MDVSVYSILNIHRIGIEAPVETVFDEVERWEGGSACWPDHLATIEGLTALTKYGGGATGISIDDRHETGLSFDLNASSAGCVSSTWPTMTFSSSAPC